MPDEPHKPRFSVDGRIENLERALKEQRLESELARHDALEAARMTAPGIRRKRKTINVAIVAIAVVALGIGLYFLLRPAPGPEVGGLEDDGWALPGVEPLPDAPELPDLEKLERERQAKKRRGGGKRVKTAVPDLLEAFGEGDETDPTAGLPE